MCLGYAFAPAMGFGHSQSYLFFLGGGVARVYSGGRCPCSRHFRLARELWEVGGILSRTDW